MVEIVWGEKMKERRTGQRRVRDRRATVSETDIVGGDCDLCGEWAGILVEGLCHACIKEHARHKWQIHALKGAMRFYKND